MPAFPEHEGRHFLWLTPAVCFVHEGTPYCVWAKMHGITSGAARPHTEKERTMRATFLAVVFLLFLIAFFGARSSIIVSGAQNFPP